MKRTKKDKRSAHEKEVARIYEQLSQIKDTSSDEYKACLEALKSLTEVECEKLRSKPKKDRSEIGKAIVVGVVGIVQIATILIYEEHNIISKKAFDLVLRGRV